MIPLSKNLTYIFEQKSFSSLLNLAFSVIAIYFIRGFFNYLQNYFTAILSFEYISEIRKKLYKLILNHCYEYNYQINNGKLTNNLTEDTEKIKEMIFSGATELIPGLITITFTLIYAVYLNWKLAFLIFILIPLISLLINIFSNLIRTQSAESQFSLSNMYLIIQQNFINMMIIKSNGYENYKLNEYIDFQNKYKNNSIKVTNYISLQPSVINIIQVTGICIIACFGASQVFNNYMRLEDLIAFATTLSLTIEPAIFITKSIGIINKSKVSLNIVNDTIKALNKNQQLYKNGTFNGNYEITITDLSFKYTDSQIEYLFKDLNFVIEQGEVLLIKGKNGQGKSTLLKILLRIIDNYKGSVKIGNIDIKEYSHQSLKKIITASFSETFLFNTSIKNNIISDIDFNDADFNKVLEILGINDFIKEFENGIDTIIESKGDNLSSGQKQRISIARSIINKPKILILDEATSSIDIKSELDIYKSIKEFLPDSTIIIVSHKDINYDFISKELVLES